MFGTKLALIFMVFLFGVRHGFEPDHLAIIDGITRGARARLSQHTGFLFSLGHGFIVVLLTAIIALGTQKYAVPTWAQDFGIWTSILSLLFFGIFNIYTTIQSNPRNADLGSMSRLLKKWVKFHPLIPSCGAPIILGMLFALSFDTLSQTVAFSINAYILAGWLFPIILGIIFMMGMMIIDGLNGYLVARIIKSANKESLFFSRLIGLGIGGSSLVIAGYSFLSYFKVI